jgi:hypothetical protein
MICQLFEALSLSRRNPGQQDASAAAHAARAFIQTIAPGGAAMSLSSRWSVAVLAILSSALLGCDGELRNRSFVEIVDFKVVGHLLTSDGFEALDFDETREPFFVQVDTRGNTPDGYTLDLFLVSLDGRNAGDELRFSSLYCEDPFGGDDCGLGRTVLDCGFFIASNGARRMVCPRANVAIDGADPSAFFANSVGLPGDYLIGVEACVVDSDDRGQLRPFCSALFAQQVVIF